MSKHDYELIHSLCTEGKTFEEIAEVLGVSRQRAHQLVCHKKGKELGLKAIREEAVRKRVLGEVRAERSTKTVEQLSRYGVSLSKEEFVSNTLRAEQNHRLMLKKYNARSAGIPFDLRWGDLDWPTFCPVLGIEIDYFADGGSRNEHSCSFDRLDNTLGYVRGNVRVMSWRANRIKNDGTAEEHRKIAEWMENLYNTGQM